MARTRARKSSRPWKGVTSLARITYEEWKSLPVETLVERRLLSLSLTQLELRCTSNTVHYVLNKEHSKDPLLNCNQLRMLLSKTPKFLPTPRPIKPSSVSQDCDLFGCRLIKTFNRFVCKDYIDKARANAESVGIIQWKPKQFPYAADYYANHVQDYFDVSKPSGTVWKRNNTACPGLKDFITSLKPRQCHMLEIS